MQRRQFTQSTTAMIGLSLRWLRGAQRQARLGHSPAELGLGATEFTYLVRVET